jgi:hypothetical protein
LGLPFFHPLLQFLGLFLGLFLCGCALLLETSVLGLGLGLGFLSLLFQLALRLLPRLGDRRFSLLACLGQLDCSCFSLLLQLVLCFLPGLCRLGLGNLRLGQFGLQLGQLRLGLFSGLGHPVRKGRLGLGHLFLRFLLDACCRRLGFLLFSLKFDLRFLVSLGDLGLSAQACLVQLGLGLFSGLDQLLLPFLLRLFQLRLGLVSRLFHL